MGETPVEERMYVVAAADQLQNTNGGPKKGKWIGLQYCISLVALTGDKPFFLGHNFMWCHYLSPFKFFNS
jgi:hypothetical protein